MPLSRPALAAGTLNMANITIACNEVEYFGDNKPWPVSARHRLGVGAEGLIVRAGADQSGRNTCHRSGESLRVLQSQPTTGVATNFAASLRGENLLQTRLRLI